MNRLESSPLRRPAARLVLAFAACLLSLAAGAAPERSSGADTQASVREGAAELDPALMGALLGSHVHGITPEISRREVGEGSVPVLLDLLHDPEFPRRDNLVAHLSHLAGGEAVEPLLRLLREGSGGGETPEEDRALLLTPHALGRMAGRGNEAALLALLDLSDPRGRSRVLAAASGRAPDPEARRSDLLERALRGLALSGAPEARRRLEEWTWASRSRSAGTRDLSRAARAGVELFDRLAERSRALAPPGAEAGVRAHGADQPQRGRGSAVARTQALDTQARAHATALDYANHVAVSAPMDDTQASTLLGEVTVRLGREDFETDVTCCALFDVDADGSARLFGSRDDGLDIVDDQAELDAVLSDPSARIKVVRVLSCCESCDDPDAVENVLGCAETPGTSIAVVRVSDFRQEGALWIHEYGHNAGLPHSEEPRLYTFPTLTNDQDGITQAECDVFHLPPAETGLVPIDVGACEDRDEDRVHDLIDNCDEPNFDQEDFDRDGTGNPCEGAVGLEAPEDMVLYYADDDPATFAWELAAYSRATVQWSRKENFNKPRRSSGRLWLVSSFTPGADLWLSILDLGKKGDPVLWRVKFKDPDGNRENTAHRSFQVAPEQPATLTAPEDGVEVFDNEPPTLEWEANHNAVYRVRFATRPDLTGRPKASSGSLFTLTGTSWGIGVTAWDRIVRRLAPKNPDGRVYYAVFARDALGRQTRSEIRSFRVIPAPEEPEE